MKVIADEDVCQVITLCSNKKVLGRTGYIHQFLAAQKLLKVLKMALLSAAGLLKAPPLGEFNFVHRPKA